MLHPFDLAYDTWATSVLGIIAQTTRKILSSQRCNYCICFITIDTTNYWSRGMLQPLKLDVQSFTKSPSPTPTQDWPYKIFRTRTLRNGHIRPKCRQRTTSLPTTKLTTCRVRQSSTILMPYRRLSYKTHTGITTRSNRPISTMTFQ